MRIVELTNGQIFYPRVGGLKNPPTPVGYQPSSYDPYVFDPILQDCQSRVFREVKLPCCYKPVMKKICLIDNKVINFKNCKECPHVGELNGPRISFQESINTHRGEGSKS